tara:strand:- start:154 stop:2427 length:2274 start_codon:yes stop_codon:yes gene_type:complete
MKQYEKIILIIFTASFGLQILDFPGKASLFIFTAGLLSLSYLFGGYTLFNLKENKNKSLSIIAGIVFSISLIIIPFSISLNQEGIYKLTPIPNALLFIYLGIYLYLKRKIETDNKIVKLIFIRSLVILIISASILYIPISVKPYRSVLYTLNNGNYQIQNNLLMFDYLEESEKSKEAEDYESAIEYAEKANKSGIIFLSILTGKLENENNSTLSQKELDNLFQTLSIENELWKINGTYTSLYNAYKLKAFKHYQNKEYKTALNYYLKADKAINVCDHNSEEWQIEEAYSINKIALCYKSLSEYEIADSLFLEAIEKYENVKDTTDRNVATFYSNIAESMFEQEEFGYSNLFYKTAVVILQKDSSNEESRKDIIRNYHSIIVNHLKNDSVEEAKYYIDQTFKLEKNVTEKVCDTKLYNGIYFYKLNQYKQAQEVLLECLDCYENKFKPTRQNIAESRLVLAQVKIQLGEYDIARDILNKGIEITIKNYGKNSIRHANYLKVDALIDKELGNYKKSEKTYYQILNAYTRELGERNSKIPEVLSGLADLEIILAKYSKAKTHSDSSMSIANYFLVLDNPWSTLLINNAAYVNYYIGIYNISDSLYHKTLKINKNYDLQSTATSATVLNGLGLLMTAKKEYEKADSLFLQSLKLHKEVFTENHPSTAVVYLNYAGLKIEQKKDLEAKEMLTKSLDINKQFFDVKHDIFADIYVAFADISKKEKQPNIAKDYYQKALDIYLEKFDENHIKVISVKEKLKGSS